MSRTRNWITVIFTVLAAACSSGDAPVAATPPTDERLIVSLSAQLDTIPEATSKPLVARVTDETGRLRSAPIFWISSDATVASVSDGIVTGIAPGLAMVIASAGEAADTTQVVVTQNELTLDVQPSAAAVVAGDTVAFVATVRSRSGDVISVNRFDWSSSDTATASFVGAGAVMTRKPGDVTISAEALMRRGWSAVKIFRSTVASISLSPSTSNVYVGDEIELEATVRDQYGRRISDEPIAWGTSNFLRATVDSDGVVLGKQGGAVVVTATAGSRTASATINVLERPAASLVLTVPSDTALVGAELQATATPLSGSGAPLGGRTIAWQSASPSIATVSSAGVVKGVTEGAANISAISDGLVATRRITVRARRAAAILVTPGSPNVTVGQTAQLLAKVLDQMGGEIVGQSVAWSSSNTAVAAISGSGLLTARASGSATITAVSGSVSETVTANIGNIPVASVSISPAAASIEVGQQASLVATAKDAGEATLPGRPVSWTSLQPSVATVSANGVVSAVAPGQAAIRATIEGKSADALLTVNAPPPAPVATVIVTLGATALNPGQATQASAVLKDAAGNILSRPVTWTTLDAAVASVSSSGTVTATGGGTVTIVATSEGKSGYGSLTVSTPPAAPVASMDLDVASQDIVVGQAVQAVVTLRDAGGNVLTGRTITYSTDNPTVVSISANGVITGVGAGTTKVRVASSGFNLEETMRVTNPVTPPAAPTVASVVVSASPTTLNVGANAQATAVAKDANGNTIAGTTFTWTTSNASRATVSSSGLVTATGAGSVTITAAASGQTGSVAMTVNTPPATPAVVASVTVSLASSSLTAGASTQATAVAKDAQGAVITGRPVTWSSTATSVATVSASGQATGVSTGSASIRATIDGVLGSASLTVTAPPTPLPPPSGSTVAELPRVYLNFPFPAKTGQTIVVPAGGNLQNALNIAQRGDEIVLAAGATYTGNFTLPAKSGTAANGWITIRSDRFAELPALGTRVTSAHAALMPKIVTASSAPALKTAAGTSGWWLVGLEVTVATSVTVQQYGIIFLGEAGSPQTTLSSVPSDLVLDRMYIHGQSNTNTNRCIGLNSARTEVSGSYIVECHGKGFDSQAIWGGNGPGPFKIVNNTLQGAGENIMFGGSDPAISGLVPSDIEIRQNYIYTPSSWKGVWTKKNLFELKNASRVLMEGNVLEGSWSDAQTGWAVIMKSANQSGNCAWCRTTDVTLRRNIIRNAGSGINIGPKDDNPNTDTTARRIALVENVVEGLGGSVYTGDRRGFQVLGGTADVLLERNVLAGTVAASLFLDPINGGTLRMVVKDNIWAHGSYGVIGTNVGVGTSALNGAAPGYAWINDTMVGSSGGSSYPAGTIWVSSESDTPVAAQVRSTVSQATAGVVIP